MRLSCPLTFLLLAIAIPCVAQNTNRLSTGTTTEPCMEELFEQAERSFDKRKFGSENLFMAERQLSKVVSLCGVYPGSFRAKIRLGVVHEELADHNLRIALFYLGKSSDGKGGKAGAVSRLKNIIERYPEFTKLDQVFFLLGELNVTDPP